MLEWLDEVAGPGYAQAVLWTLLALLLLVVLLVIIKLVRSMTHGTFVAGGRNRKARLAVTDAAAIDSHRRLVLVRRDEVEHLLLIGGATDLVIEHDIRIGQPRRVAAPAEPHRDPPPPVAPAPAHHVTAPPPPRPRPAEPPRPAAQPPRAAPERLPAPPPPRHVETLPQRPAPRVEAPRAAEPRAEPRMTPPVQAAPAVQAPVPRPAPPVAVAPSPDDLDSALLKELEVSLDDERPAKPSLDDEMSRLLGELANPRR
ncbi:MAG: flagellar biosynthetic protein FliO [Rhizobiaceae bacterium]|nr:flagellar biosynthetic protein FliO [Rhizobiaceae bacterium]